MKPRKQLYWEDVKEEQELPSSYSIPITWLKIAHYVSGTQDFNPQHHDPDFCHKMGYENPFVMLAFYNALFGRLITDWIGEDGFLCKFHMEMRKMNTLYETITMKGKVTKKYVQNGEHYVDADIWIDNDKQGITTPATCTVMLPSKG
jgi:acyl dehydratase